MPAPDERSGSDNYERSDISARVVLGGLAGLLAALGLVLVIITSFQVSTTGIPASVSRPADLIQGINSDAAPTPPAPRLEAESGASFDAYHTEAERKLSSYGWVDKRSGVAAIPIERAIDLVAQQGLPARAAATPAARDDGRTSPSGASAGRVKEAYP